MTKKLKIAFQGEPGANSHIAIVEAYPDAEPMPCATFEDALSAISSGEADLGMIPIENSVAGRVADIHHLLPDSGLFIVAEHFERIRHQLLTLPGVKLAELKTGVAEETIAFAPTGEVVVAAGDKGGKDATARLRKIVGDYTEQVNADLQQREADELKPNGRCPRKESGEDESGGEASDGDGDGEQDHASRR